MVNPIGLPVRRQLQQTSPLQTRSPRLCCIKCVLIGRQGETKLNGDSLEIEALSFSSHPPFPPTPFVGLSGWIKLNVKRYSHQSREGVVEREGRGGGVEKQEERGGGQSTRLMVPSCRYGLAMCRSASTKATRGTEEGVGVGGGMILAQAYRTTTNLLRGENKEKHRGHAAVVARLSRRQAGRQGGEGPPLQALE